MKTMLTTAMIIATLMITSHGQTAAPAAAGSCEQFWADAQKEKRADGKLRFKVDPQFRDSAMTVIKLTLEQPADGIPPKEVPGN